MDEISFNHLETEKKIVILKLLVPRHFFFFFPSWPGAGAGGRRGETDFIKLKITREISPSS